MNEKRLRDQMEMFKRFAEYGTPTELAKGFEEIANDRFNQQGEWSYIGKIWDQFVKKYNIRKAETTELLRFFISIGAVNKLGHRRGLPGVGFAPIGEAIQNKWEMQTRPRAAYNWERRVKELERKEKLESLEVYLEEIHKKLIKSSALIKIYRKRKKLGTEKHELDLPWEISTRKSLHYKRSKTEKQIKKLTQKN